jgi:hypothetical protein
LQIEGYKLASNLYGVDAVLNCPELDINDNVTFVVDTDAPNTLINDVDVIVLSIDYDELDPVEKGKGIIGIESLEESESLATFFLPNSTVIFMENKTSDTICESIDSGYVLRHNEFHEKIKQSNSLFELHYHHHLASILGLDILKHFKIHFNEFNVFLESIIHF